LWSTQIVRCHFTKCSVPGDLSVKLLIERGATDHTAGGEIASPGLAGIRELVAARLNRSKAEQMLEELDGANSIDFGLVLPVRAFRND
jgi:hypothetical protein